MTSPLIDAKSICSDKILDVMNHPMFMIFQLQHDQISEKVDTENKLLYHFKQSMGKMNQWNSTIVKDFCEKLTVKFPDLKKGEFLIKEMITLTCTVLDSAHKSEGRYVSSSFDYNDVIHSFIVECSNIFIEHPEWFSHGPDSTDYQTCMNNARIAMRNGNIVQNVVRKYVSLSTIPASSDESSGSDSESDSSDDENMEPIPGPGLYLTGDNENQESESESEDDQNVSKVINVLTGDMEERDLTVPTFSSRVLSRDDEDEIPSSAAALDISNIPGMPEMPEMSPVVTDQTKAKLLLASIIKAGPTKNDESGSSEGESESSDGESESSDGESGSSEGESGSSEGESGSSEGESGSSEGESGSSEGEDIEDGSSESEAGSDVVEMSVCDLEDDGVDSDLMDFICESSSSSDESGSGSSSDESGSSSDESGSSSDESGSGSSSDESGSGSSSDESGSDESSSSSDESGSSSDESGSDESGSSSGESGSNESGSSSDESGSGSSSGESGSNESGSSSDESGSGSSSDESGSESEESGSSSDESGSESEESEKTPSTDGSEKRPRKTKKLGVRPASRRGPSPPTSSSVPPQLLQRFGNLGN